MPSTIVPGKGKFCLVMRLGPPIRGSHLTGQPSVDVFGWSLLNVSYINKCSFWQWWQLCGMQSLANAVSNRTLKLVSS